MATHMDFKGNLLVDTGADAFARFAIGAPGQLLTPNVTQTTGLQWVEGLPYVNVKDYGAVGDGITEDTTAFQQAINAAVAEGGLKTVWIPPGTYRVDGTLSIPHGLVVRGASRLLTKITHTPVTTLFHITAPDRTTVAFGDLTIEGPSDAGFDNGAMGLSWAVGSTFHALMVVERVTITGKFDHALMRSGGGRLEVRPCLFEATDGVIAFFEPTNTAHSGFASIEGCHLSTPHGDLSARGSVGLYIHPHLPYIESTTVFQTLGPYGIYQNGSPSAPRHQAIAIGCKFIDCALAQTFRNGPSLFIGCTVTGRGSGPSVDTSLRGDLLIVGCHFQDATHITINNHGNDARYGQVLHCEFVNTTLQLQSPAGVVSRYRLQGCRFRIMDPLGSFGGGCLRAVTGDVDLRCYDSEFLDTSTTGPTNQCVQIRGDATVAAVRRCTFRGIRATNHGGQIMVQSGARVVIDDCEFDGGTELAINPYNLAANVIEGGNNWFLHGTKVRDLGGINNQQRLVRRTGINPTPVASAATLDTNTDPFLSYDTHVVTGTTTINSLSNPWPCVGMLRLVVACGASWAMDDTGNIHPKMTAARAAGSVVELLWEPLAAKWLEV